MVFWQGTIFSLSNPAVSYVACSVIIGVNLHLYKLNTVLLAEYTQSSSGMTISPV